MGNDELNNIKEIQKIKDKFYLHVTLIGEDSILDLHRFINSFQISKPNKKVSEKNEDELLNLFDFWDWTYNFDKSFKAQSKKFFDYIEYIKSNVIDNYECLIVKVNDPNSSNVKNILKKINEIMDKDYMPVTLFLCD